jgi:hypothetical protein
MARNVLIKIRRGNEADIGTLAVGELGFCEDTEKLYIGTATGNVLLVAAQTVGDMLKSIYDTNNDGKVDMAEVADSVPWTGVTEKPSTFTPSSHTHAKANITDFAHTHDDRYYTEDEINTKLNAKANLSHIHLISDVTGLQTALEGKDG